MGLGVVLGSKICKIAEVLRGMCHGHFICGGVSTGYSTAVEMGVTRPFSPK